MKSLVDARHKLRDNKLDEPQLYEQGPAPCPSALSLLFRGNVRHYAEERKGTESKDQAMTSYYDELVEAEGKGYGEIHERFRSDRDFVGSRMSPIAPVRGLERTPLHAWGNLRDLKGVSIIFSLLYISEFSRFTRPGAHPLMEDSAKFAEPGILRCFSPAMTAEGRLSKDCYLHDITWQVYLRSSSYDWKARRTRGENVLIRVSQRGLQDGKVVDAERKKGVKARPPTLLAEFERENGSHWLLQQNYELQNYVNERRDQERNKPRLPDVTGSGIAPVLFNMAGDVFDVASKFN
ncbi:hypothetical protein IW261DRAFT_1592173 [Armillaria novae-zelandiae]|uniref:Uncharacterized protein n=1 Tax=Armillaria novae-zelandiae TaxID=153914 RepID=A0AA39PEM6_9AGAR|nr:hypothetical protein IW261DRAFT_1592173 [Armillaria novae-zelandiae]